MKSFSQAEILEARCIFNLNLIYKCFEIQHTDIRMHSIENVEIQLNCVDLSYNPQ